MIGRHSSRRTEEAGRQKDLEFLTKLRSATREELLSMLANHSHKSAPEWKVVAIKRALSRAL